MSDDNDDRKQRMADAIQQAKNSARGHLLSSIAPLYFPGISSNGYLKHCHFCDTNEKTFRVYKTAGGNWIWGCFRTSCRACFGSNDVKHDAIGLVAEMEGLDWKAAKDRFLEITGVPNPYLEERPKPKAKKKAATPTPTPSPKTESAPPPKRKPASEQAIENIQQPLDQPTSISATPDEQRIPFTLDDDNDEDQEDSTPPLSTHESGEPPTPADNIISFSLADGPEAPPPDKEDPCVWQDLYDALTLTPSDREALKKKRGFNKDTIDRAGYRSSNYDNLKRLQFLLTKYPHPLLLSLGIATKDRNSGDIKISPQLTGYGLIKRGSKTEEEEWGNVEPILIPYFDRDGKVTWIRPHKGNLSGKRFMIEQGYERAFKTTRTRTQPFTNFLFYQRPEGWERKCVLTEGEHKATALAQAGIPAMAVPGIQMPKNKLFLEEMIETLRLAGIKDIIVCYDNEDKSHKPDPDDRHESYVWANYACDTLRPVGFNMSLLELPVEWRQDGKADWDGALAQFGSKAPGMFVALLKQARYYHPQTELFGNNERERIVHCKMNRLKLEPAILTGGDEEWELAKLILKTKDPYRLQLSVRDLAQELYDTKGCYYIRKKLDLKSLKPYLLLLKEIKSELEEAPRSELETIAELEAALAAVKHIIAGRPDILSDFTISCDFQVRSADGTISKLFRFKNKHGQKSKRLLAPASACSTSTKFREFCMSKGNYNPMIGDKQLQQLMIDIGTFSAWREIRELEMLGRDPESNLWIFGNCAFSPDADLFNPKIKDALFADKHDIVWDNGIGYRLDPNDLAEFAHREAPKFFLKLGKSPEDVYASIKANPMQEKIEVAKIFMQFCADMIATFGDTSGLLVIGALLSYAMAPELLAKYHGQPGCWIHGRAFAGKSETSRFLMQMWGYDSGYRTFVLSGGTTAVAIDRFLAQYSDIPAHADEFRQSEADQNRIASLRTPYNRQSKAKGRMDQSNKTRAVQPMTSPLVTGEGVTSDSATLSRYIEAILAADKRLGTKEQQIERYQRMLEDSDSYHRIIQYVLLNRAWFGKTAMAMLDEFIAAPDVNVAIKSDRLRLNYGTAFAAVNTLLQEFGTTIATANTEKTIGEFTMSQPDLILVRDHASNLRTATIAYARNAAADVTTLNMVVKFWSDVMVTLNRNPDLKKYIQFSRCVIDGSNKVTPTVHKYDDENTVRCVLVRSGELYAEYERDTRQRGQEPDLTLSNIRAQSQHERYWVPAPTNAKYQAHRISLPDIGQTRVWVLRCDRMDPSLEALFSEQFDKDIKEDEPELCPL